MTIKKFTKQPGDTLDYAFDFTDWFAGRSSTIFTYSTPVITPVEAGGLNLVTHGRTGLVVKTVLNGGNAGKSYKLTFRATTTDPTPLVKEVEALFRVKEV